MSSLEALERVKGIDALLAVIHEAQQQAERNARNNEAWRACVDALADMERSRAEIKAETIRTISCIDEPLLRSVLMARYLDGLTIEQTAERFCFCYGHMAANIIPKAQNAFCEVFCEENTQ